MTKRYSKDFKEIIIDLYQTGQSVTHLSKEYSIAPANIYKWLDLYSKPNDNSISKSDYLEFKKQLAYVKEEHDILKKY